MRYAIFSDLHDSLRGLELILADAQTQNVDELIYLGDAGHDPAVFESLHAAGAVCVFGNWEVGGYRRLAPEWSGWVAQWPASHTLDTGAQCSHATPALPAQVQTTEDAARYLRRGESARSLFPRLHIDEMARWDALAALETADCGVAFHGHTHVQMLWRYAPVANGSPGQPAAHRWQSFVEPGFYALECAAEGEPARYLVGVGSAGEPHDGPSPRYVIYDAQAATIELRALDRRL